MFRSLNKPFTSLASSSATKYPRSSIEFEQYFQDEIKPLSREGYSRYPQAPVYVIPRDFFLKGYIRCPEKYREHLLDTVQRKLIAVDDGSPLPWNAQCIPMTRKHAKVMVSIPRTIEEGWMVIHTDYSFDKNSGKESIGAILFASPATSGNDPDDYICQGSITADVVLGEGEAIKEALKKALLAGVRRVWCISDCETIIEYLKGSRDAPEVHMPIVLEIGELLDSFEDYEVVHVYRERNDAANWLAVRGREVGEFNKENEELSQNLDLYNKKVAELMAQEPCFSIRF